MKNKKNHMKRMLMLSLLTSACCIHSYATINEFTLNSYLIDGLI